MYYYVYLIKFNTGQFYIGSRQSKVTPENDTKYWGSPKTYKHLWEDTTLEKTKHILKVFSDFNKMCEFEVKLIKEAWIKYPNKCLNRHASPVFHPEAIQKANATVAKQREKEFTLKSPNGEIVNEKNIRNFCRVYDLKQGCISKLLTGRIKSYKGWTLPETNKIGHQSREKEITLKSPNGKIIREDSIRKLSIKYNLTETCISRLVNGKIKSHKGWTLPETKEIGRQLITKEYCLLSPNGEVFKGKNIHQFCKLNKLCSSSICKVLNGKRESYKGWKIATQ